MEIEQDCANVNSGSARSAKARDISADAVQSLHDSTLVRVRWLGRLVEARTNRKA
jgi:hypothetical protein